MRSIFSSLTLFYLILETSQLIWENFVLFDTCDVVYNLFISLLPPIVLDNLFVLYVYYYYIIHRNIKRSNYEKIY